MYGVSPFISELISRDKFMNSHKRTWAYGSIIVPTHLLVLHRLRRVGP
jgi:hypothetical protein